MLMLSSLMEEIYDHPWFLLVQQRVWLLLSFLTPVQKFVVCTSALVLQVSFEGLVKGNGYANGI